MAKNEKSIGLGYSEKTVLLSVAELNEFQGDLKTLSDTNYEKLKKEIIETGLAFAPHVWLNPKDKKYYLVDGHQRRRVCSKMIEDKYVLPKIPCIVVSAKTLKEAKRRVLQGTSQYGTMTDEGLYEFMSESELEWQDVKESFDFADLNMIKFGKSYFEEEDNSKDDDIPELGDEFSDLIKQGDLWILGDHRLMCGDSTSAEDMKRLVDGDAFDLVFTSPPYNADMEYSFHNDRLPEDKFLNLLKEVLANCHQFGTDNLWVLWNMGCSHHAVFWKQIAIAESIGFEVNRTLIWKKTGTTGVPVFANTRKNPVTKNYHPHFGYEFIFTFRKQKKLGREKLSDEILENRQSDVWEIDQMTGETSDRGSHPAAFPVKLAQDGIELFCDVSVFDPFCGSGSTLIAAQKLGRKCFGMEIDPKYVRVVLERFKKFTGLEPARDDGVELSALKASSVPVKRRKKA